MRKVVPLPTGVALKKGSKLRASFSLAMPAPVADTSIRT